MKHGLDHIPPKKRQELARAVQVLTDSFNAATSRRMAGHLKNGKILKIILYGSYARGDWVLDPVGQYFSDFDLLVVVDHDHLTDWEYWHEAYEQLTEELSHGALRVPTQFIVHSIKDMNAQLERGRYFFIDIVQDGIVLFEEPGHPFAEPQPLAPPTALEEAQTFFESGAQIWEGFFRSAAHAINDGDDKIAAFQLHQVAEHVYSTLLLVTTLYSPPTHNLARLHNLSILQAPRLVEVWPAANKFERRSFQRLKDAYVKARYSKHYRITTEELTWLRERVELLQTIVRKACEARLAVLRAAF